MQAPVGWVAAADGLVVLVGGAGVVDADGEGQVAVAGPAGQVLVGVQGVFAVAALGCGDQTDQAGAGGVQGGVAVVREGGVLAPGLPQTGQAQQQAAHAVSWVWGKATLVTAVVRSSKDLWWVPSAVMGVSKAPAWPWARRRRVPMRRSTAVA